MAWIKEMKIAWIEMAVKCINFSGYDFEQAVLNVQL